MCNGCVVELEQGWVGNAKNFVSEVLCAVAKHAVETFDEGEIHCVLVLIQLEVYSKCVLYVATGDVCLGPKKCWSLSWMHCACGIGVHSVQGVYRGMDDLVQVS